MFGFAKFVDQKFTNKGVGHANVVVCTLEQHAFFMAADCTTAQSIKEAKTAGDLLHAVCSNVVLVVD